MRIWSGGKSAQKKELKRQEQDELKAIVTDNSRERIAQIAAIKVKYQKLRAELDQSLYLSM